MPSASNYKLPIKCIFLNNGTSQTIPNQVVINSNEIFFYPYTVNGGICNTIDDPFARICVLNKVKKSERKNT